MIINKKYKLKSKLKLIIILVAIITVIIATLLGLYTYFKSPVSNTYEEKNIVIPSGSSYSDIAHILKNENLIRNEKFFILYLKLKGVDNIYASAYYLSSDMNLNKIVNVLLAGGHNPDEITITFKEGINMRKIASIISENTNNSYDSVFKVLNNSSYIDSLIDKYWFLTDKIKNDDIYYPLEGYLFPETYRLTSKDVSVEEIFEVMLNQMEAVLNNYKSEIESSNYSIHQLLTLASVTQSEGYNNEDFKNIASVFYNRMKDSSPLGSCVTSYYGVKKEMTEELFMSDINGSNPYNTRGDNPKLFPVGPISSPGLTAIEATMKPINTDYYFFVSDVNNKLYFTKTYDEHNAIINKLINEGLWYEW